MRREERRTQGYDHEEQDRDCRGESGWPQRIDGSQEFIGQGLSNIAGSFFSAYVASKSALDAFSRCISAEVRSDMIEITTVYMPLVRTPMIAPTKIYDYFPTITPERAADLILEGRL